MFDKIGSYLDRGKQIDVIYLDMSKSFDKVSDKRLLLRLREFGFSGNILNWFNSYLQDRRQQTTALGATSSPTPVTSGVPQDSILWPLLFLLYENNLPSRIAHSCIAIYADDTKIFKEINSLNDAVVLQEDLSNFEASSTSAGLKKGKNYMTENLLAVWKKVKTSHNKASYQPLKTDERKSF